MVSIHCMGASQEVGRSAFLFKTDKNILIDYGIKIFGKGGESEFPVESGEVNIDAAIISHAHMDHIGFLPNLYTFSKTRWIGTPPTRDLAELLLADSMKIMRDKLPFDKSHYNRALEYWIPAVYGKTMSVGDTSFRFYDAGHISGSAMVELEYQGKKILYTGDIKMESTRMHNGLKYGEKVDTLIIESTYSKKDHPDREESEIKLVNEIHETVREGGTVLLPSFALGRTQELMRAIRAHDKRIPIFVDGMGKAITDVYLKHRDYIKDPEGFRRDVRTVKMVRTPPDRYAAVDQPGVIISSAGMMEGGPALWYLTNINKNSKIIFTGYCVEGTNGWRLINEGKVNINGNELEVELPVEKYDFSAHAGRTDLLDLIKKTNPEKIVLVHGDSTVEFAEELKNDFGFEAFAPKVGEHLEI